MGIEGALMEAVKEAQDGTRVSSVPQAHARRAAGAGGRGSGREGGGGPEAGGAGGPREGASRAGGAGAAAEAGASAGRLAGGRCGAGCGRLLVAGWGAGPEGRLESSCLKLAGTLGRKKRLKLGPGKKRSGSVWSGKSTSSGRSRSGKSAKRSAELCCVLMWAGPCSVLGSGFSYWDSGGWGSGPCLGLVKGRPRSRWGEFWFLAWKGLV